MVEIRICAKCKNEKFISEFHKSQFYCKKCSKRYLKKYRKNNPLKAWCTNVISSHKRRRHKVKFKPKELMEIVKQTKYCPICNIELDWIYNKEFKPNSPTLDRIDNGNELNLNNIQILCNRCNATKSDRTMKEFVDYCVKVTEKYAY